MHRASHIPNRRDAMLQHRVGRYLTKLHVRVQLETGRTHQIRVHLAHIGYPLVGDPVYARLRFPKGASAELNEKLKTFTRQALHARRLGLVHPGTGESCLWECELPADFVSLLDAIKADAQPATL